MYPLTAAEFRNQHCVGDYDFFYCWPNRTGNPWVDRRSTLMRCVVNAVTGDVRFRFSILEADGWHARQDRIVLRGGVADYYYYGAAKRRRCEVLDNDGVLVHFSVRGND